MRPRCAFGQVNRLLNAAFNSEDLSMAMGGSWFILSSLDHPSEHSCNLPMQRVSDIIRPIKRYAVYLSRRIVALSWAACLKGLVERVSFFPTHCEPFMPEYRYLGDDHIEPASIAVVGIFGNGSRDHVGALNQRMS